jgi:hypothetical protein
MATRSYYYYHNYCVYYNNCDCIVQVQGGSQGGQPGLAPADQVLTATRCWPIWMPGSYTSITYFKLVV